MRRFLISLLIGLTPVAAKAQDASDGREISPIEDAFERGCGDDDGNDRCDPEIQKKMRALYRSARNDPAILALCHRLRGDRLAAADALRLTQELEAADTLPDEKTLRSWFAYGRRERIPEFRQAADGAQFYLAAPRATDADHAIVMGDLVKWSANDADPDQSASITLELVRDYHDFEINAFTVGDWKALPAGE